MKKGYEHPVGWWKVTTEGDCEGKTINNLGVFYGHVVDIALHLGDKAYYGLTFEPFLDVGDALPQKERVYKPTVEGVWLCLGINSGTWDKTDDRRKKWFDDWLGRPSYIDVLDNLPNMSLYASVYIRRRG